MKVKDLLRFGGLRNAEVAAGKAGLEHTVESVSVLEVAEAKISTWVTRNQLYITSFYAIKDTVGMQKVVIETLAKCGCCGLVICHKSLILGTVHPEVIALCDALDFPLLIARSEVSYVEILNPIIAKLEMNGASGGGYAKIKSEFLDLILREDDMGMVLKRISYELGYEISFFDIGRRCVYSNKSDMEKEREIRYLQEHGGEHKSQRSSVWRDGPQKKLLYAIQESGSFFGYMIVNLRDEQALTEAVKAADRLSMPCALLFGRRDRLENEESRLRQEYISDLLVWNFRDEEVAVRRGFELGMDITDKNNVVVVNLNRVQLLEDEQTAQRLRNSIGQWFFPSLCKIATARGKTNFVCYRSDTLILFLSNPDETLDLKGLCGEILKLFAANTETTVSIGISDWFRYDRGIPEAYNQAFDAAILGRKYCGENQVSAFCDLWFYHRLKKLRQDPGAVVQCRKILEPLYRYDQEKDGRLLETLEALFDNGMDLAKTAAKLYIHRNTLLYRKRQIAEVLGYNPFELPHMLNVLSALCVLRE